MNKTNIKLFAIVGLIALTTSCKEEKKAVTQEAKPVQEMVTATKYKADPAKTFITWDAHKLVGGHQGTINASGGVLKVENGKLVGGSFIIDVNSITCTDIPAGGKNDKLIAHLKNEDFFETEKFPNGAFEITSVTNKAGKDIIAGNLSLKGVKKNIEFPAMVTISEASLMITSEEFVIDRTDFNIMHNSAKTADAAALGDYLIKDNVHITVNIIANK